MRFDYYQASVKGADYGLIMRELSNVKYFDDWKESKAGKGYRYAAQLQNAGVVCATLQWGGSNEEHGPNVTGSGQNAVMVSDVLRAKFPVHRVSRVDACIDYYHSDAYKYLRKAAIKVALTRKIECREIIKPVEASDDGCTIYLGAPSSIFTSRIYEKGKQLGGDSSWVRLEGQLRPAKNLKDIAARLSPTDVWGCAKWAIDLRTACGAVGLKRVKAIVETSSDHARTERWLIRQYGPHLLRLLYQHGSWEAVGTHLGIRVMESPSLSVAHRLEAFEADGEVIQPEQ